MIVVALAAGLTVGCQQRDTPTDPNRQESDAVTNLSEFEAALQSGEPVQLFAGKGFYLARGEPEVTLTGTLTRIPIRTGPNTREHPIRLHNDEGEWSVYTSGLPADLLDSLLNQPLIVTGKWIDQSAEGLPVEFWIGRVVVE